VVGAALAGKAADGLEKEAGIQSRTLASWLLAWDRGKDAPDAKTVFVIDEAGMVDSRQMAAFVQTVARSGGKLVLVGDADQLQPIEAGAAFRSLTDRVGYAELGTIYRQCEQWMRDASMDLARGNVVTAIRAYQDNHRIVSSPLKGQAIERLINDWNREYDPGKSSLILAHLRHDVHRLNELARGKLIERGLIDVGFAFRTEEGTRNFAPGDQIVFLKNDRELGVKNGMLARVIEAGEGRIVAEIGDIGSSDKRRVEVNQSKYRNVDHGYATTIHKSQGATVDRVKVLATLSLDRHLTYVAMTRHRENVMLYHGGLSFEKNGGLSENLSKKGAKDTTLDYAGSTTYDAALHYAESRGLYGLHVAKAFIVNQRRFVADGRATLQALGGKLAEIARTFSSAMRGETRGPSPATIASAPAQSSSHRIASEPLLKGVQVWPQTVKQEVESRMEGDATLSPLWEKVQRRMSLVYAKPDEALKAMNLQAIVTVENAPQLVSVLTQGIEADAPQFGELRGKTGLFAGKADKETRAIAERNVSTLSREIENYMRVRDIVSAKNADDIGRRRDTAELDIPALSPATEKVFARIRDAIDRGDLKAGLSYALADKMVEKELAEVAVALDKRFGGRAFLGSKVPEGPAFDAAARQVAPGDKAMLAEIWPKLHAHQKLAAEKRATEMNKARVKAQAQAKDQGLTR
jgi:hypothetical protein